MNLLKSNLLFVVIFLIITNSFAQKQAKTKHAKKATLVTKSSRTIIESPENDQAVLTLGYYLQDAIINDSIDNYMSKFDLRTFGKFITSKTERDASLNEHKNTYLKGIYKSINAVPRKIIDEVANGSYYDFVNYSYDNEMKTYYMLFRIFSDETGVNYHDYRVSKLGDDFVFNDMYIYLSGETLSETFGRMYLYSIPKSNLLGLFGSSDADDYDKLLNATVHYNKGEYKTAYKKINKIKGSISKDKFFLTLKNLIASNINDKVYIESMEELLNQYPDDPSLYLTLADYHLYKEDNEAALNTLDNLIYQTQDDFLNNLKASIEYDRGNFETAQELYKIIVDNYPDYMMGISNYLACISNTKDFNTGTEFLDSLLEQGFEKPGLIEFIEELNEDGTNEFEVFAKSEEFINWKTL